MVLTNVDDGVSLPGFKYGFAIYWIGNFGKLFKLSVPQFLHGVTMKTNELIQTRHRFICLLLQNNHPKQLFICS